MVKPWLPVPPSAKTHNFASERKDANSILSFYRQLLAMRHKEPALLDGSYVALNEDDAHVMSYLRKYKDETILAALNMSGAEQRVRFDLAAQGFAEARMMPLLSDLPNSVRREEDALVLGAFAVFIARVSK